MSRHFQSVSEVKMDMTPMMDVCFQLIIFFILIMTIAKDENSQKVKLPLALNPPIIEDEQVPNSININVTPSAQLLGWGETINMRSPAGLGRFADLMALEARQIRDEQAASGKNPRTQGLDATVIVRVSEDVEYEIFQRIMETCRELGFRQFQLKARPEEDAVGSP